MMLRGDYNHMNEVDVSLQYMYYMSQITKPSLRLFVKQLDMFNKVIICMLARVCSSFSSNFEPSQPIQCLLHPEEREKNPVNSTQIPTKKNVIGRWEL